MPVDQLLPRDDDDRPRRRPHRPRPLAESRRSVTIDLVRLRELDGPGAELLVRYLQMIQVQRQDFNGRMLTVRRDDLRAIACILDTQPRRTPSATSSPWASA